MNPFSTEMPRLHVVAGGIPELDQYVSRLRYEAGSRLAIRLARGANMQSMECFYNEVAAAFQFPLYFGKNWAALDECLADLEWMPSEGYVLLFSEAPLILRSSGEGDADAFIKLLARISDEWAEGVSFGVDRGPRPFNVLLHASVAEADPLAERTTALTGSSVPVLTLPHVAK
jgi:RNAse (barnase) inhibitor barstar